ncbi:dihydrolipoyllysine-residue acetyltransferase component of acetoin cleaving system [Kordia sp. SMS9]|uniref:alpha/beta fold hydrolase n=1 Tax=Kordia sp. SMS9 TaxID=2282170 RepID=UPI000E0DAC1C|nr:alpha/beta hydrolase [Kordia sp. SMS9]AXG69316.1 dihydrolipoyllysine-residue acetyltransferase component of acetoin cleaving system [Kordia sp. SMS9]
MQQFVTYKNIEIAYTVSGEGSAVVFLHGFLETSNMWQPYVNAFSNTHKVITIDLLGHGKTPCLGYIHTMEEMAETVFAVVKTLRLRKLHILGHSMGGYVALAFAEKYPDYVKALCLINSTSRADSEERKVNRDRAINAVKYNHKQFIRISIANLFRPKNRKIFAKQLREVKKEALTTTLQGIVAALEGMKIREDREVLLHFSPYKKMMIIGKHDPVLDFKDLIDQTKNSEVDVDIFPDGHMSHIENKEDLLFSLARFLSN